jgi:salicylate hydroxylase
MANRALIAGAGLGGLAAALACTRAGCAVQMLEQAAQLSEAGAGIQLGPNATRILLRWELGPAFARVAAFPGQLRVRSALTGEELGCLRLGDAIAERYGAPYATVHRADLQQLLLDAVKSAGIELCLSCRVAGVTNSSEGVTLRTAAAVDALVEGDLLAGADGLWSSVRHEIWGGAMPSSTGHLAYRSLVVQGELPAALRSQEIAVWLGPHMHLVAYPVRGGELLNVVAIVQGEVRAHWQDWDHASAAADLHAALGRMSAPLRDLVNAMPAWRMWPLHERPPVRSAQEMVRGRVALVGDAAHPMRPYFAQGAGMAIEDADELGRCLSLARDRAQVPDVLQRYAANRWRRNARVQRRSARNGRIFHATGPMRLGRDFALKVLGERLLDADWLYR